MNPSGMWCAWCRERLGNGGNSQVDNFGMYKEHSLCQWYRHGKNASMLLLELDNMETRRAWTLAVCGVRSYGVTRIDEIQVSFITPVCRRRQPLATEGLVLRELWCEAMCYCPQTICDFLAFWWNRGSWFGRLSLTQRLVGFCCCKVLLQTVVRNRFCILISLRAKVYIYQGWAWAWAWACNKEGNTQCSALQLKNSPMKAPPGHTRQPDNTLFVQVVRGESGILSPLLILLHQTETATTAVPLWSTRGGWLKAVNYGQYQPCWASPVRGSQTW